MTNIIDELLKRRMIAVLGKGGVGRTSVSGALAMLAAGRGLRTLAVETDPQTPLAAGLGKRPGFAPRRLAANLWGMFLGGQESLEDYLGKVVPRPILRIVLGSSIYQHFVHAAPAMRELMMMGKIYDAIERRSPGEPRWDMIVFDTPASGQALSMLRMPFVARERFGESLVGREANEVARLFRDRALSAIVAVTTAEPLAMAETLELSRVLEQLELEITAVAFNRRSPVAFETTDIARMVRRVTREPALRHLDYFAGIARSELKRKNREARALEVLRRQIGAPRIVLQERRGFAGSALLADLTSQLAAGAGSATSFQADAQPWG
ncbi:MAG TPA: ArsA family ATPase [Candidatus Binataceae bacterium]|nr:ArsA family ATPase [Candidatus Binataceae bacterium]